MGGIQLLAALFQFLFARFQLTQGFFQFPLGILDFHIGVIQFLFVLIDLLLAVFQFFETVGVFLLTVQQLLIAVQQLLFALFQIPEGLFQFFFAVGQFDEAVGIFLLAFGQVGQRVGQLLLTLGGLVGQLLFGLVQFFLGVSDQPVSPDVLLGLSQRFHPLQDGVNQCLIPVGKGFGPLAALHHGVNVGIVIHVQHAVADINDGPQLAVAHGGAAPLDHGEIIRRGNNAHDLIFLHQEGVLGGFFLALLRFRRQQGEGLSHRKGLGGQFGVQHDHALMFGLRPAALGQHRAVHDAIAVAFPSGDPVETAHHRVTGRQGDLPVQTAGCHDGADPLHLGDSLQIALFQT